MLRFPTRGFIQILDELRTGRFTPVEVRVNIVNEYSQRLSSEIVSHLTCTARPQASEPYACATQMLGCALHRSLRLAMSEGFNEHKGHGEPIRHPAAFS